MPSSPAVPAGRRPRAVAFDVNETLIDLSGLRDVLTGLGLAPTSLEWWFASVLRDGLALAATGDTATFPALGIVALEEVCSASGTPLPDGAGDALLRAFAALEPFPDVAPALEHLAGAGIAAYTLTNGSPATTTGLLERAGLDRLVTRVLSVEGAGLWKPRPEPYHYAAGEIGVEPGELALVAVHPWDLHGGARAGLTTGWTNRTGRRFPAVFVAPHATGTSLEETVAALLALPGA